LFDGHCHLCSGWVQFVLQRDRAQRFRFAALQSEAAQRLLGGRLSGGALDTVVLLEGDRLLLRSSAALRVCRWLGGGWRLTAIFWLIPRPLRDAVYHFVAAHRYRWFGRREACWLPEPAFRARFLDAGEEPVSSSGRV
jgi:predicted DCC family thiol-disulfide oxidoreductase YuxK